MLEEMDEEFGVGALVEEEFQKSKVSCQIVDFISYNINIIILLVIIY